MGFAELPSTAAWRHCDARDGFEVVFVRPADRGHYRFEGYTAAVEGAEAWAVRYAVVIDSRWLTQSARVAGRSATRTYELILESNGRGSWEVNGEPAPQLDGCLDVDLEASALTNALPVHRLGLQIGQEAQSPAAYVRAPGPSVERLEQRYRRLEDSGGGQRYHYEAPAFEFECDLAYDASGLVSSYPGIAVRMA